MRLCRLSEKPKLAWERLTAKRSTMPTALSPSKRRALWNAAQQGLSTTELARRFHLSDRGVRQLLQLGRANNGVIPPPRYRYKQTVTDTTNVVKQRALALKQQHPHWGTRYLRGVLVKQLPTETICDERTLRRWLRPSAAPAAKPGRFRTTSRVTVTHQRWQIDACDQMPLQDGTLISWLRAVDECTGAVLGTKVFPLWSVQSGRADVGARAIPLLV
jgi:hypothetical protein